MAAADDDLDSGLFNIALSDSEGEDGGAATETTRDRTGQTEEEFQAVKRVYRPKVDNGEVSLLLVFGSGPSTPNASLVWYTNRTLQEYKTNMPTNVPRYGNRY